MKKLNNGQNNNKYLGKKVAVLNSNEDMVEMIQLVLGEEGFSTCSEHIHNFKKGKSSTVEFLRIHNPDVILYDIAPPYEENLHFFETFRNLKEADNIAFVLTTTNVKALESLDKELSAIEIIGKPFDLDEIVRSVKSCIDGDLNSKKIIKD